MHLLNGIFLSTQFLSPTIILGHASQCAVIFESETSIICVAPHGLFGVVNVTVFRGDNGASSNEEVGMCANPPARISFVAPRITKVVPRTLSNSRYTRVSVFGSNFFSGMDILFGAWSCKNIVLNNSLVASCDAPPVDGLTTHIVGIAHGIYATVHSSPVVGIVEIRPPVVRPVLKFLCTPFGW